uniref:Threonylcarbamoyl-AMP synthase n=1 Tax=Arion vulgaris TaxID=1028688 RepID=A0A0B7A6L4_9EUPU
MLPISSKLTIFKRAWQQSIHFCHFKKSLNLKSCNYSSTCRNSDHHLFSCRNYSQEHNKLSKMAAAEVVEKEIGCPNLMSCNSKFKMVKNGGNGMSKAFSDVVSFSASCLQNGGVIAVPTDTVYGVACLVQNTEAVNRIYEIKNRNFQNPVAISVGDIDDIYRWSKVTVSREVLSDLLPGPVTVVFERSPELNLSLNPQTNLVGIRIPNHLFIQTLAQHCKTPIALTSANISGTGSCLRVECT